MTSTSLAEALDSPSWAALTSLQAHLGYGNEWARRYHAAVAPFAGLSSESPAAYRGLSALLQPGEHVILQSLNPVQEMDRTQVANLGVVHQMVATQRIGVLEAGFHVHLLGERDLGDILDLVHRTRPGPFGTRTVEMGRYIGLREGGRLIAMVGERMRLEGYVELSAVCVDEQWRGKGIAGELMKSLCANIEAQGATPFLHVLADNTSAIGLYERLGFELRRKFFLTKLGKT